MKPLTIPLLATLIVLLISSCLGPAGKLLGFGDDKNATTETTVTEQVINPTATPLPTPTPPLIAVGEQEAAGISQASAEQIIDLLDLSAPSSQMRVARHNAGEFSFEIPPGWEVVHLEGDGEFLVCRIGDEVFGGAASDHPYVYFRLVPWDGNALSTSVLTDMRETLAGVDMAEDFTSPTLDDRSAVGQFVSGKLGGKGNVIHYRAYLLAVPLPDKKQLAQMIFWGPEQDWPNDARDMALVLETILWQALG